MDETQVHLTMDERSVKAIHSAVCYTLQNWSGQGELDQERLLEMKPMLQACLFEFQLNRSQ